MKKSLFVLLLFISQFMYAQPKLQNAGSKNEYSLIYELYGGVNSVLNDSSYVENETVVLNKPTRAYYTFGGWFWDSKFEKPVENNTFTGKSGPLKVYALWLKRLNRADFDSQNMVEIIPAGKKVALENFAHSEGLQEIFSYKISKYEVTQELFRTVAKKNPSKHQGDNLPVEYVTWCDAIVFCNKLSVLLGLEPVYSVNGITDVSKWNCYVETTWNGLMIEGEVKQDITKNGYRLPTQAEWEFAARGGVNGGWNYKYAGSDNINDVAWYYGHSDKETHPVGMKKANSCGLYDMSGNVSEFCWDGNGWGEYVKRGGSWGSYDNDCTISSYYMGGKFGMDSTGFRIVCKAE